jgi:hypothetical protein
MIKETPLQPIIEALESAKTSIQSKEIIIGLDFALTLVKGYERNVEQDLELARLKGVSETLEQLNEKLSRVESKFDEVAKDIS